VSAPPAPRPPLPPSARGGRGGIDRLDGVVRRHRVRLVGRLVGIAAATGVAVWLGVGGQTGGAVVAGFVAAVQVPFLVRSVERPVRDLVRFLDGVRNDDLSMSFTGGRGPLLDAVRAALTDVVEAFRRVRSEREEQAQYLQTVVRHVGVALVAVRDDGHVALFNEAAGRLLGVRSPRTLGALAARRPALADALRDVRAGRRALVEVDRDDRDLTLVVQTTRFQLGGALYTLASLQDIRPELEEKEAEAWQQLTRVLTHEIMNSVAPIASLAETAGDLLGDDRSEAARAGALEALGVIRRRCDGLVHFVEAYRSVSHLPRPSFQVVPAGPLLGDVTTLVRATARGQGPDLRLRVEPPGLELVADPDLLEQALVNVVLNAVQALDGVDGGRVEVVARPGPSGRPTIDVTDNGPGLSPETRERVFVPFFTTKAGGSGIGLGLARQIMRLHGGTLTVHSVPDEATTFSLRF
jgi:two-component system nitrogen regulation sensor histidine kinase NtrY